MYLSQGREFKEFVIKIIHIFFRYAFVKSNSLNFNNTIEEGSASLLIPHSRKHKLRNVWINVNENKKEKKRGWGGGVWDGSPQGHHPKGFSCTCHLAMSPPILCGNMDGSYAKSLPCSFRSTISS